MPAVERAPATVIVCSRDRRSMLEACLRHVAAAMGSDDELVVVEGGPVVGPDPTTDLGVRATWLTCERPGKSRQLNQGAAAATGEILLITDDDCRVPPGWVDAMVAAFAAARTSGNDRTGVAFGPVRGLTGVPGPPLPQLPPGPAPIEHWVYAHGASMAVRREALVDVGGFDERFGPGAGVHGEEADLVLRLREAGWGCRIADAPAVEHDLWRTEAETADNVLVYERGSGALLGAALRRHSVVHLKVVLVRLKYQAQLWGRPGLRGWGFGPRTSLAFLRGLVTGLRFRPLRPRHPLRPLPAPMTGERRIRVLWVTQELPDRQLGGGNIRQAELITALGRSLDIDLVLIGTLRDQRTREALSGLTEIDDPGMPQPRTHIGARLTSLWIVLGRREPREVFLCRRQRRVLAAAIREAGEGYDVVVVNHQGLIPLLPAERRTPWVLALQYVSAQRTRQWGATARQTHRRWLFDREAALEEQLETDAVASYDGVIVVSTDDAARLGGADRVGGAEAQGAGRRMWVVPNGVDTTRIAPTPLPSEHRILLSASLNYPPNADGAVWFCRNVLPLVQEAVPDVEFDIVGREPGPEVTALGELAGVAVHGDVPDMLPWLQRCRVAVVPLRLGTGTRLKALEALAAGRPVVGTTIGLEGLDLVADRHVAVADEPAAMADAIVRLLVDDTEAERLRAAGRQLVEDRFRWEAVGASFAAELITWLARRPAGLRN